jgi:hypothetical protein
LFFFGKKIFKHKGTKKPQKVIRPSAEIRIGGHKRRLKLFLFFIFVRPPWRMPALWLRVECFFCSFAAQ